MIYFIKLSKISWFTHSSCQLLPERENCQYVAIQLKWSWEVSYCGQRGQVSLGMIPWRVNQTQLNHHIKHVAVSCAEITSWQTFLQTKKHHPSGASSLFHASQSLHSPLMMMSRSPQLELNLPHGKPLWGTSGIRAFSLLFIQDEHMIWVSMIMRYVTCGTLLTRRQMIDHVEETFGNAQMNTFLD